MKRIKLKNGIMLAAMAAIMTVTGLGITQGNAEAANTSDVSWSFSLGANSTTFNYITPRKKTNSTKIYLNWGSTSSSLTKIIVSPFGYNGSYIPAGTSEGGQIDYTVKNLGKYSITNYVNENGFSWASVGIRSGSGNGTARGVWSPDSLLSYETLKVE